MLKPLTQAIAHILEQVEQLSVSERAELTDRLVETLICEIPPDIEQAHLIEVRRRIAELESGAVTPIPGDEVMAEIRRIVETGRAD